ncbi:MAG: ArsA family ATPase [Wenzhouxiangella sp.]|nr:MAG: ArsA family ATPase [Wenzhouxiangella sp.]
MAGGAQTGPATLAGSTWRARCASDARALDSGNAGSRRTQRAGGGVFATMIDALVEQQRILIVGGSGGVGKTSISAALGIAAAQAGHKTLVLTIDPARRLAAALGLDGIGPEAVDITPGLTEQGLEVPGELHAMMLDVQNTLDRAVERYAPSPRRRDQILANRLYRNISTRLSGSQEYASMQRLYEIATSGEYDRIVLDTPPTTHALDFLTAPERLKAFFDSSLIKVFINFGGRAGRGLFRVSDVLFKALNRLTGANVIRDIGDFFQVAESILEPFSEQAEQAQALLRRPETSFVVVTGPYPHQLDDAREFQSKLSGMRIRVGAMVVNRWFVPLQSGKPDLPDAVASAELEDRMAYWASALECQAHEQTAAIDQLEQRTEVPVIRVPELETDIHSIEGLKELKARLSAASWS